MREVEFEIPSGVPLDRVGMILETLCERHGLEVSLRTSLASYPGSSHWHFRKRGSTGTLEITLFPNKQRVWAKLQDGRRADWIEPHLEKIKHDFEVYVDPKSKERK